MLALVISLVALLTSFFSLYVASLRRAMLEVDVIRADLRHSTTSRTVPVASGLNVTLLASNSGAQPALVDMIQVAELNADVDIWGPVSGTGTFTQAQFPHVMEGTDARSHEYFFVVENRVGQAEGALEDFVERAERLKRINLVVEWRYHRSGGAPFHIKGLPKRWQHGRRQEIKTQQVPIDVAAYLASLGTLWREGGRPDLADRVDPDDRTRPDSDP